MSDTGPHDILAFVATEPGRLLPGTVLVADELLRPGLPAIPCPAAPLIAGELGRRGVRTTGGPLLLGPTDRSAGPGGAERDHSGQPPTRMAGSGQVTVLAAALSGAAGRVG